MSGFFRRRREPEPVAARLDGRELSGAFRRYMDTGGNPREEGLGRGGRIDTANGHVILICADREVFVNRDIHTVECGELMNLSGAIFSGYNEVTGQEDTILVYYQSH